MRRLPKTPRSHGELWLQEVSVSFPVYQARSRSLKNKLLNRGSAGHIASDANSRITVEALRNVSLKLKGGDRVALVGSNGSGKTTLLRVMAGIHEPAMGWVRRLGRVSPMFDIGLGIDGEMTGYDNIRLRGLLLGLSPEEIESKIPDIADFVELGDYLDLPVRGYSAGMITRLTFAVATCFSPEILLMDEWIMAGDAAFVGKAQKRISAFVAGASILVLASHNLDTCRQFCDKALWMERGSVKAFGHVDAVLADYSNGGTV